MARVLFLGSLQSISTLPEKSTYCYRNYPTRNVDFLKLQVTTLLSYNSGCPREIGDTKSSSER